MKLYFETTVFNYYFDTERDGHADTLRLFESVREGKHEAYTSIYTVEELEDAQDPKRSRMIALIDEYNITVLPVTNESNMLANLYVAEKIIPARFLLDGAHIGVACIYGLDYIISYNFKHINRAKVKLLTGRVNHEKGYGTSVICTAKEVLEDEINEE